MCDASWPSRWNFHFTMVNCMLCLHTSSVNLQNVTWYIVAARGSFVLMAKCKSSSTFFHIDLRSIAHWTFSLILFFQIEFIFSPINPIFQPLLPIWILIAPPFEHFVLKLLPPFLPIFAQVQPRNVHLSSWCFSCSWSRVLHLTLGNGTSWEL